MRLPFNYVNMFLKFFRWFALNMMITYSKNLSCCHNCLEKLKLYFVSGSTKELHRKPLRNSIVLHMLSFDNQAQTSEKTSEIRFSS